jgi:hypothetical protein
MDHLALRPTRRMHPSRTPPHVCTPPHLAVRTHLAFGHLEVAPACSEAASLKPCDRTPQRFLYIAQ